jgi:NADP-dependent 3-hydroxy acid dehydrogenase YdfG
MADINEAGLRTQEARLRACGYAGEVVPVVLDVTNGDAWKNVVENHVKSGKNLDIVVNNAGTSYKNKARLMARLRRTKLTQNRIR